MSEPITWRSVSAPNFGASAALLNSGTETVNQGITSLAALAKGYADEQKGIAVSNAVADMSNATNDADLGSAFAAHSANLKDHGIDLKDLIAARQAQHTTLNSDAELKSNLAMHDSTIKMNDSSMENDAIKRIGYGFDNQTAEGKLKNLVLEQQDAHKSNEQNILQSNSSIATNAEQAASAVASAAHYNAATTALEVAAKKELDRTNGINSVFSLYQRPEFQRKDGTGADTGLLATEAQKLGISAENFNLGLGAIKEASGQAAKEAAAIKKSEITREDEYRVQKHKDAIELRRIEKPLSAIDFKTRGSEVAKSLTWAGGFLDKSTLEGQIQTLASAVGQSKAMSIVGDSLGSDGNIDFEKLNTNIGQASLKKTASTD
jgi:hypothetical protein